MFLIERPESAIVVNVTLLRVHYALIPTYS